MSRSGKSGLDYFPLDIDIFDDEKIELVSAKYGIIAELIVIKLLTRIYRNGYYLEWNEDISYIFAKKFGDGITKELLDKVIDELMNRDFFSVEKYKKYTVLTSRCIQRIYLEATKRRKTVDLFKHLLLLKSKDVNILNQNVNIIEQNALILQQSKVKESKKKVKEREKESSKDILSGKPDDVIPYKEIIGYLNLKTDSNYRHKTERYRALIRARWNEGHREEDFKYVIDIKTEEWQNDLEFNKFLRPDTLFSNKFGGYRNQKRKEDIANKDDEAIIEEYYRKHPEERYKE